MAYRFPISTAEFSEALGYQAGLHIPTIWNTSYSNLDDRVAGLSGPDKVWFKVPLDDGPHHSMAQYQQRVKGFNITISASASSETRRYNADGTSELRSTAQYSISQLTLEYVFVGGSELQYLPNPAPDNANVEVINPTQRKFGAVFCRKDAKQVGDDGLEIGTYQTTDYSGSTSVTETGKLKLFFPRSKIRSFLYYNANENNNVAYVMSDTEKGDRLIYNIKDDNSPSAGTFGNIVDGSLFLYDWSISTAPAPRTSIAFPAPIATWDMQSMKILGIKRSASDDPIPLGESGTRTTRSGTDSISASWTYFYT